MASSQSTGAAKAALSTALTTTSGQVHRPARYLAISRPTVASSTTIRAGSQKPQSAGSSTAIREPSSVVQRWKC